MTGRLGREPIVRETRSGMTMVTTSIAVAVNKPGDPSISQWFNVAAFGKLAELLAEHSKGAVITLSGTVTKSSYVHRDGDERENWNLTVDWILTAGEAPARSERPTKSPQQRQPQRSLNRSLYSAAHRSGRVPPSSVMADDQVDDLWREPAP
jgi:single-stranded DNA-binding protein